MKLFTCAIFLLLFQSFFLTAAEAPKLMPWPKSAKVSSGKLKISSIKSISAADSELLPLAEILAQDLLRVAGAKAKASKGSSGDVVLKLSKGVKYDEGYALKVTSSKVSIQAKTYRGAVWGAMTFLQSISGYDDAATAPAMTVSDAPHAPYRGVLIDVARNWHTVETMRELINMCRVYKINYIQLHLNDQQSTVFPFQSVSGITTTKKLKPKEYKGRQRSYTVEEIKGLVKFADERGVTLVPEISGPGHHAGNLRKAFGRGNTLDIYNEKTYEGMAKILKEVAEVFASSPWIHIGGDEGSFGHLGKSPEEKAYKKKVKAEGLLVHYIKRIDQINKKLGKKTIVWEGFHDKKGHLPRDIVVMPYEGYLNPPGNLAKQGFKLISTPWKPLYVVNGRKWSAEYIYDSWNMWNWQHHMKTSMNIQLKKDDKVIGAQMCAWEQYEWKEIPSLKERLHAVAEKTWAPHLKSKYKDFAPRAAHVENLVNLVNGHVIYQAKGLPGFSKNWVEYFTEPFELTLSASENGSTHYTLDGKEPTKSSKKYTGPLKLSKSDASPSKHFFNSRKKRHEMVGPMIRVMVRRYDSSGNPLSEKPIEQIYWHNSDRS